MAFWPAQVKTGQDKKDQHQGTGTGNLFANRANRQVTMQLLNKLEKFPTLNFRQDFSRIGVDQDVLTAPCSFFDNIYGTRSTWILCHGNTVDLHLRGSPVKMLIQLSRRKLVTLLNLNRITVGIYPF